MKIANQMDYQGDIYGASKSRKYVNNKSDNSISGHWNLIFLDKNNNLNLFDSYGDFFNDCNLIGMVVGKKPSSVNLVN